MALSIENFTDLELEIVGSLATHSPQKVVDLASDTEVISTEKLRQVRHREVKNALSRLITGGWVIHRRVDDDYILSYSGSLLAKSNKLV